MLSYIYQIAFYFEHNHGYRPNTLYLGKAHFQRLCREFDNPDDLDAIIRYLGMNILISDESVQPHVAYLQRRLSHETIHRPKRSQHIVQINRS